MSSPYATRRRDRIVVATCNVLLRRVASREYRAFSALVVRLGLAALLAEPGAKGALAKGAPTRGDKEG